MTTLLGSTATGVNSSNSNLGGTAFALRLQALASGTVTTIGVRSTDTANASLHGAIYADNAGNLTSAARLSGDITTPTPSGGWHVYTVSPGVDVVAGQFYWLEFMATGGYNYTDFATSGGTERDTSGLSTLATTHPTTTNSFTNQFNTYADGVVKSSVFSPLLTMLRQGGKQRALALLLIKPQPVVVSLDQSIDLSGLGLSNPAQFGAVSIVQDQFISITGFQDAAQFGTFRVDQTVPVVGFLDDAQFGVVRVDDTVPLAGFQNAAQFGTFRVDQTVPLVGFQDSAQFGGPVPDQTVNLAGFSSPAQFGLVTIDTGTGPPPTTLRNRSTMGAGE
jgi:hypothetical protein